MNRLLLYTPAAERTLNRMDRPDAERIMRALETFAAAGYVDVKALKGPLKGRYRLRVGKWRIFSVLNHPIPWLSLMSRTAAKPTEAIWT